VDLNLQIKPKTDDSLVASYTCPCGCNPRLGFARGTEHVQDGCCCGNEFAVGSDAARRLVPHDGFRQEIQTFEAPWGEPLQAVWTIGASVGHGGPAHHHEHASAEAESHDHSDDAVGAEIDPVCGMTVDRAGAITKDLHLQHSGTDYYFCGRGCKLEFGDDPTKYLDPSYIASM
jgi:YHS domain-containing protein